MAPVLEAQSLRRVYSMAAGETVALDGVSLRVEQGEFVAITGPSGSGKSTLMNIIGLLDRPTSGIYRLDGIDVSDLTEKEAAEVRSQRIGFVFQSFNLLPRTSVMRNVVLPMAYTGVPRAERVRRASAALALVGLEEDRHQHKSNELSGGQMQRVAIARALVNDPALILADEPTGNLDSKTGEMVLRTFEQLRDQGRTIILITHEPDVAARADRIIHVRDGRIEQGADRL